MKKETAAPGFAWSPMPGPWGFVQGGATALSACLPGLPAAQLLLAYSLSGELEAVRDHLIGQ